MDYTKEDYFNNMTLFRSILKERIFEVFQNNPYISIYDFKSVKLETTAKYALRIQKRYEREQVELSQESNALQRLYERVFFMWEAGRDKEKLFTTLYAFPPDDGSYAYLTKQKVNLLNRGEELLPLNLNEEYSDHFLKCLCGRAKTIKNSKSSIDSANRSRFFFIGDIGSGKTTFLNYIFSKNFKYLNAMNVMWVRVDLTKSYQSFTEQGEDKPLHEALLFQIARLYRKYYFKAEESAELVKLLEEGFEQLILSGRLSKDEVKGYIDKFFFEYDRENISELHPVVLQGIKKYVQSKYSFIFLFDGLDNLYAGDWFEHKKMEIQRYILGNEKTKHLYIFVMRTASHADFLESFLLGHEKRTLSSLRKVAKTFRVLAPKLQTIVENRLSLLCDKRDEILDENKDDIIVPEIRGDDINNKLYQDLKKSVSWINTETIEAYYDIFLRFIFRGLSLEENEALIPDWNKRLAYSALKNVVGENFRVLLDVLSSLHKVFLQTIEGVGLRPPDIVSMSILLNQEDPSQFNYESHIKNLKKILSRHYRVIPPLMRKKAAYIHPYEYIYSNEGNLELNPRQDSVTYIFNIFMGANACHKENEPYHLLSKIRILQLLKQGTKADKTEVTENLYSMFGYKKEYLKIDLEELDNMKRLLP